MTEGAEPERPRRDDQQSLPVATDLALARLLVQLEQVPFDFLTAPAAVLEQSTPEPKDAQLDE